MHNARYGRFAGQEARGSGAPVLLLACQGAADPAEQTSSRRTKSSMVTYRALHAFAYVPMASLNVLLAPQAL